MIVLMTARLWLVLAGYAAALFTAGLLAGYSIWARPGRRPRARGRDERARAAITGPPRPAEARTDALRDADTVVSDATLDEWAARYHGAPIVADITTTPQMHVHLHAAPRNVVYTPAAPMLARAHAPERPPWWVPAVADWCWHEDARREHEYQHTLAVLDAERETLFSGWPT